MTTKPLLTIVIPTYNRAVYLDLLLSTLHTELQGIEDKVAIIVGDNDSPDNTPTITSNYIDLIVNYNILRHATNTGEENFAICVEQVKTNYFWMIGDDDLPKTGVLRKIVDLLEFEEIDLLYLNSEWLPNIVSSNAGKPFTSELNSKRVTSIEFAKCANVRVTFISGMVVNLKRLRELYPEIDIKKYNNTSFIQLGWILPLIASGSNFQLVNESVILATSGNTGGYKLFTAFGKNLPSILLAILGQNSKEYKLITKYLFIKYIPSLIWATRFKHVGSFENEDILKEIKCDWKYLLIIVPLAKLPKIFAFLFYLASKIVRL